MAKTNDESGDLVALLVKSEDQISGLTGAQIAAACKAALSDFVGRKTSRSSTREVTRILGVALASRRQELAEKDDLTSQRVTQFY